MLFVQRLQSDFDRTPAALRKACNFRDALAKHQCCAMFIHFLNCFQRIAPPAEFNIAKENLQGQFMSGLLDFDLSHAVESQVPPGDISAVAGFRSFVSQVENSAQLAREKKNEELAQELRKSDFKYVLAKLESDLNVLKDRSPTANAQAIKTAKDLKYVHDRHRIPG